MTGWHLTDVVRCCDFMGEMGDNMDKPYLREFLFVSSRFYLKNIVFLSKSMARVDDRVALDRCCVILCFFWIEGVITRTNHISMSSYSFLFISI